MMSKKGQSTLEYVIVLTAIIAVVIVVAAGLLKDKTKASLDHVSTQMFEQVKKINYGNATIDDDAGELKPPGGTGDEDAGEL